MKKFHYLIFAGTIFLSSCACDKKEEQAYNYPATKQVDTTDVYFGQQVKDPYRWLEDDRSAETAEWVKAQNTLTQDYIGKIPFRQNIKDHLTQIWNYPKSGIPEKHGDNYFVYKNSGLQGQSVLYILRGGLEAEPEVFIDPNTMSKDGTWALSNTSVSKDGKYLAYSFSKGGSDWVEIRVKDVETGEDLDDHIQWVKFSGMSFKDHGFYYSAYDAPSEDNKLKGKNEYHKVYYHKLNTPQSEDVLVYEDKDHPLRNHYAYTSEDEKYLFVGSSEGTSGGSFKVKDLEKDGDYIVLASDFDNRHSAVDNYDGKLLLKTDYKAPKGRVVEVDLSNPEKENWKDIIPEKEEVLNGAGILGNLIAASYMKDATDKIYFYNMDGSFNHELELPTVGSVSGFSGEKGDNDIIYGFTSFTYPKTAFKYNLETKKQELFEKSKVKFNPEDYQVEQKFYASKDGTKVPMFIIHKKGIELDGNNPTLLYGYGGFNISLKPRFSITKLPFVENGGIYVIANLRGGGEYGEEWHQAGTKMNKQNVFDDFISAAEYLIAEKYTNPSKLAINGGSNGGLLVGAAMTQRPELFAVAIPQVGVLDMLRFHKFTIGWAWTGDYGSSEDNEDMFKYLYGYSPLHNVKEGVKYPATLAFTGDHDDRVVPAHTFKFMSELQKKYPKGNPVMVRIETQAGHGAGKPTDKIIDESADMWAFVMKNLGMNPYSKQ
ncbi:MAG: prolyl oligopeptidase family protein [Hyphomicrobiales bacterium]